jgi:Survival motor neuron protein (SMN)
LFAQVSSDDVDEDDTWDDSVLVDAYDKAVGLAMKEVQRRMEKGHDSDDQEKGSKKKTKKKRSGEKNKSVDGPVKVT